MKKSLGLTVGALVLALSGCGGGSGGGGGFPFIPSAVTPPPTDTSVAVSGTAASGAPAVGSLVSLHCANGVGASATTAAGGTWSTKLAAPVFPCLATVSGGSLPAGQKLHSLLRAAGYVNVTPLTELILARAAKATPSSIESVSAADLTALAAKLDAAQADIVGLLAESGYGAFAPNPFTAEFKAAAGDAYDDLLEHLALSFADGDTTLDGIVAALLAAGEDDSYDLPITRTLKSADLAALPQLNKAHLSSANGVLSMTLDAGASAVGQYVGGGSGNKAVLQMAGLAGTKLKDIGKIELELKGDAGGIGVGKPYAYLNFTVDLTCDATPLAANAKLNDVRARRRIVIYDPFYRFIQPQPSMISTTEFSTIAITQATGGWRVSAGSSLGNVAMGSSNYSGLETLEGFDYATYPNACIVDGITGDGGMFRNTAQSECVSNAALDPATAPATCGAPYTGAILVLGDSGTIVPAQWSVKRVKVAAKRQQTFRFE